ncbi:MAG: YraN family protein [Pirellulales bacterium]|nr:YraN family protein [Pirellulales bacterium]
MELHAILSAWRRRWFPQRTLGERGERAAERYLRRRGHKIVARRQRSPIGELDLVTVDGRTVVFVEVKTRESHAAGHPAEAVDLAKQQRLTRLAALFLKRHDLLDCSSRFDVIAVTWPEGARRPTIEHFEHAFEATGNASG